MKELIPFAFFVLLPAAAIANPLSSNLQLSTSASGNYEARNIFVHPAAMAFDTELNGNSFLTSYTYGSTYRKEGIHALGLSYGNFGFGWENLTDTGRVFSRYTLASALALTSQIFVGTRFSFTGSDTLALSGVHSLDLGVQYRPLPFLSVGLMGNRLNQPVLSGIRQPIQWVAAATIKPIPQLELSIDIDTPSNHFGRVLGYQGMGRFDVLPGLQVYGGYNKDYKMHVGLQIDLARARLFSTVGPQSSTDGARFTIGFQTAAIPKRSFLTPKSTLEITLDSNLSEERIEPSFFERGSDSLLDILQELENAEREPSIRGVFLKIEKFPLGLAAASEVHRALLKVRAKGKEVDATFGQGGATEYLIACAANRIHMEPNGELRILGPRSERFYAKGTLDKIGIEGQFLAKGDYKSAPETFMRKEASPKSREATAHELKVLEQEYVALLTQSRKISAADYKKITAHGLFSAKAALEFKLVDAVTPSREVEEKLKDTAFFRSTGAIGIERLNLPSRIAVVTAAGDILQKKVRLLTLGGGSQITPDRFERHLERALLDERTKAIVIRVSSPGGEVLASQQIASMVESAKKKKPVIISMGDYAASGGYMISAPADTIFADPLTATGSIGVFLGKVSLENLYKKIDLRKEIVSSYPLAGIYSESRAWNSLERTAMSRQLDHYYDGFVSHVAQKRGLKREEAEAAAKGRVWLGSDATQRKLVDKKGGMMDAIQFARERVAANDAEVWPVVDTFGLFSLLENGGMMNTPTSGMTEELAQIFLSLEAARNLGWIASLRDKPFLYWDPIQLEN